jgi:hypothetical protein
MNTEPGVSGREKMMQPFRLIRPCHAALGSIIPFDQVSLSSPFAISHLASQRLSGVGIEDLLDGAMHLFLARVVLS